MRYFFSDPFSGLCQRAECVCVQRIRVALLLMTTQSTTEGTSAGDVAFCLFSQGKWEVAKEDVGRREDVTYIIS